MNQTSFSTAAAFTGVVTSSEASSAPPSTGFSEYGEMIADINRTPQMTALTWFRLLIAGQLARPTRH